MTWWMRVLVLFYLSGVGVYPTAMIMRSKTWAPGRHGFRTSFFWYSITRGPFWPFLLAQDVMSFLIRAPFVVIERAKARHHRRG